MQSKPYHTVRRPKEADNLYTRRMAELRDMMNELELLREQIEHTERQAIERGVIEADRP